MGLKKIHVLQVIGEFTSGGAESVVVNLAKSLDPARVQLTFTARRNGPVSQGLPSGSNLVIIPKKNGFDIQHMASLVRLIRRANVDIVHTHLFGPNLFGFLAAKLTGRKIIQTMHGGDCLATGKRVRAYRFMAPRVDQVVTVSELLEDEFRKKVNCRGLRLITIHNGVEVNRFNRPVDRNMKLKCLGLPTDLKIIGAVGNVKPIKGYDILLEALVILKQQKISDFLLVIVGEVFPNNKSYKKGLDEFIIKNNLENHVFFLGYQQDVSEILHLFDLYVLSSRSEGLPLSLLEAMAARKPVVVTDVGMNSRIVQNGFNGFVVPPESPESIADAIVRVLKDVDYCREIANNAFNTVQEKYSDNQMANKYMFLYKEVLSG